MAGTPHADKDARIGCGVCVNAEEAIREAVDLCPVSCIHWKE